MIADVIRAIYLQPGEAEKDFGDPLRTKEDRSFFNWLNEPTDSETDVSRRITRLWRAVYGARSDLQSAFPNVQTTDRERFLSWTVTSGIRESNCRIVSVGRTG